LKHSRQEMEQRIQIEMDHGIHVLGKYLQGELKVFNAKYPPTNTWHSRAIAILLHSDKSDRLR
jgi:hypothetical protein